MPSECKVFNRLPRCVRPKHYNLRLKPDLEEAIFRGWIEISVDVIDDTDVVKMNSVDLEFEHVKVNGKEEKFELDNDNQTMTIKLTNALSGGNSADILCTFTGKLQEKGQESLSRDFKSSVFLP